MQKMVKRYRRKPPNVERSLCLLGCIIVYYLSPWCLRGYATTYNCQSRVVVVVVSFEPLESLFWGCWCWVRFNNNAPSAVFPVGGSRKWRAGSQNEGGSGERHGRSASACEFERVWEGGSREGRESGAKTYDRDRYHWSWNVAELEWINRNGLKF